MILCDVDAHEPDDPKSKMTPVASPPRYMQILAILRARVESGAYALEASLPTEGELCEELAASSYPGGKAETRLTYCPARRRSRATSSGGDL